MIRSAPAVILVIISTVCALAQSGFGPIPPRSVLGNPGSTTIPPVVFPISQLGPPISVMTYGADPTGTADSTSAFQQAIAAAQAITPTSGTVFIPCGYYRITPGVLQINTDSTSIVGQDASCTILTRYADTGPVLTFTKSSGVLFGITVSNIQIADIPAQTGAAGYSTCANSPYHLVFDGLNGLRISHVRAIFGCGAFAFRGVVFSNFLDLAANTALIPGASGENNLGTMFYMGSSANVTNPYSSNNFIDQVDLEAGAQTAGGAKAAYGMWIDGCDGCWSSSGHIAAAGVADMRVSHSGSNPMGNIQVSNWMWDITPGNGILFDGSVPVTHSRFSGRVSSGAFPTIAKDGISITGAGCLNDVELNVQVDGFGGGGIVSTASNCQNIAIRPAGAITNNNLAGGAHAGISFSIANGITIAGGIVGGDGKVTPNIALGAGVVNATISGVQAGYGAGFGITVANGAGPVALVGNILTGNASGALQNNAAVGQVTTWANSGLVDSDLTVNSTAHVGNIIMSSTTIPMTSPNQLAFGAFDVSPGTATCPSGTVGGKTVVACLVASISGATVYIPLF
jgi:hypothetical protein